MVRDALGFYYSQEKLQECCLKSIIIDGCDDIWLFRDDMGKEKPPTDRGLFH